MTISKTLDQMLSRMEQTVDEDQPVAASCLRIDVNRWAENHACYRCQKAVWIAGSIPPATPKMGQPAAKKVFNWGMSLGGCGAFLPVTFQPNSDDDHFPKAPFFVLPRAKIRVTEARSPLVPASVREVVQAWQKGNFHCAKRHVRAGANDAN